MATRDSTQHVRYRRKFMKVLRWTVLIFLLSFIFPELSIVAIWISILTVWYGVLSFMEWLEKFTNT